MRILVIEDDTLILQTIVDLLRLEGYDTLAEMDGASAIACIQTEKPDLIISDISLPGADGFDVLRATKEDPTTQNTPFIVLSAVTSTEAIATAKELGCDIYMTKPFTGDQLMDSIRQVTSD